MAKDGEYMGGEGREEDVGRGIIGGGVAREGGEGRGGVRVRGQGRGEERGGVINLNNQNLNLNKEKTSKRCLT